MSSEIKHLIRTDVPDRLGVHFTWLRFQAAVKRARRGEPSITEVARKIRDADVIKPEDDEVRNNLYGER